MKKGKDGRYHSKVLLAPGMKPVYYEAPTVRELQQKRQAILDAYVNGPETRSVAFVSVVDEWFTLIKKPRLRTESTAVRYAIVIRKIKRGFSDHILAKAVTYRMLQGFVDSLAKGTGLSSVHMLINILKQICRYAVVEGYMDKDPSSALMNPITAEPSTRHALSPAQVQELFSLQQYRPGLPLLIAYYTGCRISEVLALTWADIDFQADEVRIDKALSRVASVHDNVTTTKTKAGVRTIPLLPELKRVLLPMRGLPNARVLPRNRDNFYSHSTFGDDLHGLREQGITVSFSAHCLRHHFATSCYLANIPLTLTMRWMGHTSYRMTADTYTDVKRAIEDGESIDRELSKSLQKVGQKLDAGSAAW